MSNDNTQMIKKAQRLSPVELIEAHYKYVNYPGPILERMLSLVPPMTSVLDIGAGDGAFTIPFAKIVQHITIVEPSLAQTAWLLENAERSELNNIEVINKRWEEVNKKDLDLYDVVIASHCFLMPDIKAAIQKMICHTKKTLFLVAKAGNGLNEIFDQVFRNYCNNSCDYINLYNYLYQLNYLANVNIIIRMFSHPWDLMIDILRLSYPISDDTELNLFQCLERDGQIMRDHNGYWINSWHKDALIWYNVDENHRS